MQKSNNLFNITGIQEFWKSYGATFYMPTVLVFCLQMVNAHSGLVIKIKSCTTIRCNCLLLHFHYACLIHIPLKKESPATRMLCYVIEFREPGKKLLTDFCVYILNRKETYD